MKSNRLSLEPSWKPVWLLVWTARIGGRICTSPSPNMPAGRMETVRREGWEEARLAARTRASASAFEGISDCDCVKSG